MNRLSFLIQKSSDQRLFASFPRHIAGYHVFRRLSMPRHPPYTLSILTTFIDHRHGRRQGTARIPAWELTTTHPGPLFLADLSGRAETVPDSDACTPGTGEINNGSISPKRCSTTSLIPACKTEKPQTKTGRRGCRE